MTWGFLWIMLALKIPLIALIVIVWWAIRSKPEEEPPSSGGDGGIRREHSHRPRPFPRNPRRGPHGGLPPASPARVRTVRAKARRVEH